MKVSVTEFLGLKKNIVGILLIVLLIEMGERLGERFLPIYIIALGGSAIAVGLLNALDNLLSALYSFPGGYLSDKIGYKKSLLFFDFIAMLGYLIVIVFPHWQAALVGAVLFVSWSAISLPAIMSAIADSLPSKKTTMGVTLHSTIRRIPMALGPIVGGLCIMQWGEKEGVRVAFTFALILGLIAIFLQQTLIHETKVSLSANLSKNPWAIFKKMDANLKRLLFSDILIRFCEQIPYAFVVIWCMKNIGISALDFATLTTIEMVTAILIYLPVAWMVEKTGKRKLFVAITFGFFSLFPLLLIFSQSFWFLLVVFIIRGLKEFGEPTRKALILHLSPNENKATFYGTYYLLRDIVVSVAAFAGGLLWTYAPTLNLMVAFIFGVIGTCYYIFFCGEEIMSEK